MQAKLGRLRHKFSETRTWRLMLNPGVAILILADRGGMCDFCSANCSP